jgi:hypothetical protein
MSCYIASSDNRIYAAQESTYGTVPAIGSQHRFGGFDLRATQRIMAGRRRDKTGSRSFAGYPQNLRRETTFTLRHYLSGIQTGSTAPGYGALVHAAFGGTVLQFAGATARTGGSASQLVFNNPHGLVVGQAVTYQDEIRFVTGIIDGRAVNLCAPFSSPLGSGSVLGPTVTYMLGDDLPSVSLFDYWDPQTALHRIFRGAGIGSMSLKINGDYHEFEYSGAAADLIDNLSFETGQGSLTQFPDEPATSEFDASPVPGHLGQIWLGTNPGQIQTVTEATVSLNNGLDMRAREFGSQLPMCLVAGVRSVEFNCSLYESDSDDVRGLYQAARQESPIQVMLQLGQQQSQLCGLYMKSLVPAVPDLDDTDTRLQWKFGSSPAQGSYNDELYIAFG